MTKENLPNRLQKDEDFGGYIGIEDIYDGEHAKRIDMSKFEDVIKKSKDIVSKSREKSISLKRAHNVKTSLLAPKHTIPMHAIKTSSGSGKSQLSKSILKSRLDNVIKQIEKKGIKGAVPAGIGGAALGGILGGPMGALAGGGLGTAAGHISEEAAKKSKKMKKADKIEKVLPLLPLAIGAGAGMLGSKLMGQKKMRKAGGRTMAGTAIGSGLGAAVGGPIGAGLGGVAGGAIGSKFEKKPPIIAKKPKDMLKSKAYLSVEKAINLIKGYSPMGDNSIRKAFGGQIPESAQDPSNRPPEDWWNKCMSEVGDENQCLTMWNKEASQSQAPWTEEKGPGDVEQPEQDGQPKTGEDEVDYDNLGKWMGGALQGGTLSSLLGHPVAGQAIQAAGKEIGRKILGQEVDDEQAQKIGMAAFDAIENIINESGDDSMKKQWPALAARMIPTLARGAMKVAPAALTGYQAGQMGANRAMSKRGIEQKAVVQQLDKKITDEALKKREPKFDFGGESEISEGSKVDIEPLVERSETQDETGTKSKIDSKKIAHSYKDV